MNKLGLMRRSMEHDQGLSLSKSLKNKMAVEMLGEEVKRRRQETILRREDKIG